MEKAWKVVQAMNEQAGAKFFKVMVDATCGDSELDIPQNEAVIKEMAEAGGLGIFHASAKTTRGCALNGRRLDWSTDVRCRPHG